MEQLNDEDIKIKDSGRKSFSALEPCLLQQRPDIVTDVTLAVLRYTKEKHVL
jgi:hypothetical protein